MIWFVKTYFAAAGKCEGSQLSPTLFTPVRHLHPLRFEASQSRRNVVAHKENRAGRSCPNHGTRLRVEAWRKVTSRGRHQRRKTEVHREKKPGQLLHPWYTQRHALH